MSVVFSTSGIAIVDDVGGGGANFSPSQLYWTSGVAVVGGGGQYAMLFTSVDGGEWVLWSLTQSDGVNMTVTIAVSGDPVIQNFGATDGQIYSPANLPRLSANQPVAVSGFGTPGESVFFNVLLRRTTAHDC